MLIYDGDGPKQPISPIRVVNLLKDLAFRRDTMVILHDKSKKSPTGSRYVRSEKKRLSQMGSRPTHTKLGDNKRETSRRRGDNTKVRQTAGNTVNLADGKGKCMKATIKSIVENPANRNFVRRNIITKGTVIDTDKGKARVTSRPGQDGTINAVLVKV